MAGFLMCLLLGNVTHEIPGIQPMFVIPTLIGDTGPHTPGFAEAAGTYDSFLRALDVAKGLATAGYQILADPQLRRQTWKEHVNKEVDVIQSGKLQKRLERWR
jgi:hypothetical protein